MAFAVLLCLVHLLNLVKFFSACKGCLLTEATPPKKRGKVTVYIPYMCRTPEKRSPSFFLPFWSFFGPTRIGVTPLPPRVCVCSQEKKHMGGVGRRGERDAEFIHSPTGKQRTGPHPPTVPRGEAREKGRGGE